MPVTPAPPTPVTITYALDADATRTEAFDYLIVACDPRGLAIDDPTALEARVKEALTSFTFHTSLFKADRPGMDAARGPAYASRFNPSALEKMDGSPYAFRDEVFAHDPVLKADKTGKTWCVLYQLEGKPLIGRKREEVRKELNKVRDKTIADGGIVDGGGDGQTWIDWKPDGSEKPQPEEDTLVDYFAHFDDKELDEGLPWAIRDAQGEKNTFYVASFTCFESVLHCYLYEEQLMDPKGRVVKEGIFPADKTKSFAVVGAGPSGLLFATQHLLKKGYANFKIFEASDRFGGKTFTYRRKAPGDGSEVPCELGTCFLSPAYEPMWWLFEEYDAGKIISLDRDSNLFQSVIDKDEAKTPEEKCDGVEYRAWTVRKNGPDLEAEQKKIVFQTVLYCAVHYAVMGLGINDAMPPKSPDELSVIENFRKLIFDARKRERKASRDLNAVGEDKISVLALFEQLQEMDREARKSEEEHKREIKARDVDATPAEPRGLFNVLDDIGDLIEKAASTVANIHIPDHFNIGELEKACKNVFYTTYGDFLDKHGLGSLKSLVTYGYSVQGYGAINKIPAYYGFVWITPAIMLAEVKNKFIPSAPGTPEAARGTVDIVTKGWLTLWEKMVERDLQGRIVYNATITSIKRDVA